MNSCPSPISSARTGAGILEHPQLLGLHRLEQGTEGRLPEPQAVALGAGDPPPHDVITPVTADYMERVYLIEARDSFTLQERVDAQRAAESDPCLDAEDLGAPSKYIITGRAGSGKSTLGTLPPTYEYQVASRREEAPDSEFIARRTSRPYRSTRPEELPPDYRRVMVRAVLAWCTSSSRLRLPRRSSSPTSPPPVPLCGTGRSRVMARC